jgi:hypothetical protein
MGDFIKVSGGAAVAVLVAGLAGQAREVRAPGGTFELERKISLDCYIDNNHMLNVGSVHAIRKGTRIWFVAKLENAGPYARSILRPASFLRIFT